MREEISIQAKYKWESILTGLGIEPRFLKRKHGPCPVCGGKDRFRFDNKEGTGSYYCNQCGGGFGINLVMNYFGVDFKEAAKKVREIIGDATMDKYKRDSVSDKKSSDRLKFVHKGLSRIKEGDAVSLYLKKRGIKILPERDVYIHNSIPYYGPRNKDVVGVHKAMVCRVSDQSGKLLTYHITYLDDFGNKADLETARVILSPVGKLQACSIKMFDCNEVLAVAEGVETALAFYNDSGIPAHSCLNSTLLTGASIPDGVKHVYIVTDEDKSFTGQMAAYTLANRLKVKHGLSVSVVRLIAGAQSLEMSIDNGLGIDFNDYIKGV